GCGWRMPLIRNRAARLTHLRIIPWRMPVFPPRAARPWGAAPASSSSSVLTTPAANSFLAYTSPIPSMEMTFGMCMTPVVLKLDGKAVPTPSAPATSLFETLLSRTYQSAWDRAAPSESIPDPAPTMSDEITSTKGEDHNIIGSYHCASECRHRHTPRYRSLAAKVSPCDKSPVSNPRRNQRMRCSEVPWVNESGTT